MKTYHINSEGYYGEFGGAHIPEILMPNVKSLQENYLRVMNDPEFQKEFDQLLHDYVGRPTPLYHAENLSKKYGCKVYLKREDLNHTGAHKINNAIGQILMAKRMGKKRIIAETGAGQHGVAAATVCTLMNMECEIYMGEMDIQRQMLNVKKMEMLGAKVISVKSGNQGLKEAVDKAILNWCAHPEDTHYLIGSAVGPHPFPDIVARFQSVISQEIKAQLQEKEGRDHPDYIVACIGGGSNAAGAIYHYLDNPEVKLFLAEAAGKGLDSGQTAATIHLGKPGVLHGMQTLVLQDKEGNPLEPYSISAGLDYPAISPLHANLAKEKRAEFTAINDQEAIDAALELTRLEGIIPAIESSHALAALGKKTFKPEDIVVLSLSGRGDKDMETYLQYL